ncbi:hypothetical protein [Parasitella parasitica]|uniref:Uncharacterized protein n=1 Tax=Parasitella parasitica TaxID=35722 RepID=A0A0B7MT59_9FUNG|nr:hypothetical protein [Parasitella parasitica]
MENEPSTVASKGFVYRKLQEIQFVQSLNRKRFRSLQEKVLQSINSSETFVPGKKLSSLTLQQISILQQFIDTVKARIEDRTFFPAKCTDPRDAQALWRLVKQSNVPWYRPGAKTETDLTDAYHDLFRFSKLGFRTRESLSTGILLRNSTDLVLKKTEGYVEKKPSDFINDIQLGCQIFAIDPGIRDITTAVDQSGRERKTSLNEYYHLCGFNTASTQREEHKKQHMNEYQQISTLSSFKTTNLDDFVKACKERFDLYDIIKKYYDSDNRSSKLRFKCYIKKQKCVDEICRRLTFGSSKYGQKSKMAAKKQKTTYVPPSPIDDAKPRKTILAFGNGGQRAQFGKCHNSQVKAKSTCCIAVSETHLQYGMESRHNGSKKHFVFFFSKVRQ